jgi:hydroxymethylglutaryl-CoA reductase (NADPH)
MKPKPLPPVPRDSEDDYTPQAAARRLALWKRSGAALPVHLSGAPVPHAQARGKIENLVGFAQVPLGLAGPLVCDTSKGLRQVYVPLATTEGAMVASYSRGMKLLAAGGGARARVLREGLTQNPVLVYADNRAAEAARAKAARSLARWQKLVARQTRHGALVRLEPRTIGRRLVLQLVFTTGDAIGINMAARAADAISTDLAERTGALERHVHGQDVEKRANARALIEGRGRSVVAEATLPRRALQELARTTPERMVAILDTYRVGYSELGTHNWLVQAANGLAGLFLACGQDLAYVVECATGQLDFALDARGDLYASVHLPTMLVGTVGGGSGQGTARECLELLGCQGPGSARALAELAAATVLAGELSLMAAFTAGEFVAAHERLGRNRPPA